VVALLSVELPRREDVIESTPKVFPPIGGPRETGLVCNFLVKGTRAAPANLHPLRFDFLMMNPIRIFDAQLIGVDEPTATIQIDEHVDPKADRDEAPIETMPPSLCKPEELRALVDDSPKLLEPALAQGRTMDDVEAALGRTGSAYRDGMDAVLTDVPPAARVLIPMRGKRIKTTAPTYRRRAAGV
jgi:hypothetical protein